MIGAHTGLTKKVFAYKPIDQPVEEIQPPKDRAFFANSQKTSLLSAATKVKHLTPYIGTELQGVQLSLLNEKQKDELALLVAEVSLPVQILKSFEIFKGKQGRELTKWYLIIERCRVF
jgi:sulfonate dioxygenase